MGTIVYTKELTIDKTTDLGTIQITITETLQEVAVTDKKRMVETKIDRTVYNIENTARSIGSDALQLMKGIPTISVTGSNIELSVKSSVKVLINDKLTYMSGVDLNNYLMSINSETIKSIEIITNQPAKYEADGNSGLINIVLKKSPVDSWSSTIRNLYFQSSHSMWNGGINFVYNKKKSNLFLDFTTRKGAAAGDEEAFNNFGSEDWNTNVRRKDFSMLYRTTAAYDYELSSKTTIGGKFIGFFDTPNIRDRSTTNILDNNVLISKFNTNGFNNYLSQNLLSTAYITQKLDTLGSKMTLDLDRIDFKESQDRSYQTEAFNPQNEFLNTLE